MALLLVAAERGREPARRVLDAIVVAVPADHHVAGICQAGTEPDTELVALVRSASLSTDGDYTDVRQAWRLDRKARRIRSIPPAGILCPEPTFGAD